MPGRKLKIEINNSMDVRMTREVRQICEGYLSNEFIEDI
jgi:phosphoribosylformylglycinamidine (FGAM) synthase PurS component